MKHKEVLIWILITIFPPVAADYSVIEVTNVGGDYSSIQRAIEAARPGDVIEIQKGTYLENVVVNKMLTLRGISMPVVDADGNGSAIVLKADGVVLEGVTAINSSGYVFQGMPDRFGGAGILIYSDNNTLKNNIASSNNGCGIIIHWASSDNTLIENNISFNLEKGVFLGGSNNSLVRNIVSNNTKTGIYIDGANDNVLDGNTVSNNMDGIYLTLSDNNTLLHNYICGNAVGNLTDLGRNNRVDSSNRINGEQLIV
jgi:parallel beta-helix repeat protein